MGAPSGRSGELAEPHSPFLSGGFLTAVPERERIVEFALLLPDPETGALTGRVSVRPETVGCPDGEACKCLQSSPHPGHPPHAQPGLLSQTLSPSAATALGPPGNPGLL